MEILELFEKLLKIKMIGSTAEWRGRGMTINLKTEQHKLLKPEITEKRTEEEKFNTGGKTILTLREI